MQDHLSLLATIIALCSLFIIMIQTRLLRKDLETRNYQDLLSKLFSARDSLINAPELGSMFTENPAFKSILDVSSMSINEFFGFLNILQFGKTSIIKEKRGSWVTKPGSHM